MKTSNMSSPTTSHQRMDESIAGTVDSNEESLYKIGGVATLIIPAMYLITGGVDARAYSAGPFPGSVTEWFTLFQNDSLTGLFFLGFADIIIMLVSGPMFLALYAALKRANKTWSLIAASFTFVGMAVYLATNTAFSMLSLSHQYAAATTIEEKDMLLAAGQAILAGVESTGGRYTGLPLVWATSLMASAVMLRSKNFNKVTAYAGILAFALLIVSVPYATYTSTGPTTAVVGAIIAVTYAGGGLLSLAWYILVGLRLLKLGRLERRMLPQQP